MDLPGIIEGAKDGKGRGRQVIATARTCNLILITLDAMKPMTHKKIIEVSNLLLRSAEAYLLQNELEGFGIRLNKTYPNIVFRRKDKGGINFTHTVRCCNVQLFANLLFRRSNQLIWT